MTLTKNELKLIKTFCSIFTNNTKDELKASLGANTFKKKGRNSARHFDKCQYVLEVLKKQWVSQEKGEDYDIIYREGYEEGANEMKSEMGKMNAEMEKLKKENEKLKEELAEKDASKDTEWHIWMNEELGNKLYPLNPPMPTEFVRKVKELKKEAVEEKWQGGYDEGVLENSVDKEYLEELEDKIKTLEDKIKTLDRENEEIRRESAEVEEAIELVGNPETIYACNNIWYK